MWNYTIGFDRPQFLLLLVLIPLVWAASHRSMAGLGRWRRAAAFALRSVVIAAIVLALADAQMRRRSDRLTVAYVLDQSLSVPAESRGAMLDFVKRSIDRSEEKRPLDRFAVVSFGRDATVETPPVDLAAPPPARFEGLVDPEYTDVAAAIQRAQSVFPRDSARRIVLVTDGNENLGNVYRQARAASDAGVGIDVAPVFIAPRGDVAVEKAEAPASARRGQPFEVRVVLRNDAPPDAAAPAAGSLVIVRKAGEREEVIANQRVEVQPGKSVFAFREELDSTDFYAYEARFVPDDPTADATPQNNQASAFVGVRGRGAVLVIENADRPGEYDYLVDRLRSQGMEVSLTATDRLFNSLAELQRFDSVVLAGVPRATADDAGNGAGFSDEQIDMLVRNTKELGCGLVMLGGPDAFGAGGWANTELEKAMPLDFHVNAAKVIPVGALAIVLDRSGSMAGEKLAMSKAAAIAAMRTMGRRDFISVVAFDGAPQQIVPLRRVADFASAARRVDAIGSGGGTDVFPAMQRGFMELDKADAAVKHMIVLTDGLTPDADFRGLVARMRARKITVTALAVGNDANVALLQDIASRGGGKFYGVRSPRNLPRIFMREVRRVARPLIFEMSSPVAPAIVGDHEILRGMERGAPPISGMVLTTVKENPLVEVLLQSPQPATEQNAAVLAAWTYGAGRTAAFTTDAGKRWASAWTAWEGYDKFFSQLVRWSMRPADGEAKYTVAADVRQGRAEIVVSAIEDDDDAPATMTATAVAPDMKSVSLRLEQTAPGRYVGRFPADLPGSYLVMVSPGGRQTPIRTGVNVGYSSEYNDRQTNLALLESLARLSPRGGKPGAFLRQGMDAVDEQGWTAFRHDLPTVNSSQPVWPWLVAAACCVFWGDVFVRRVHVNVAWLPPALAAVRDRVFGRSPQAAAPATIDRLRTRKAQVAQQIDRRAASARYASPGVAPRLAADDARPSAPTAPSATQMTAHDASPSPPTLEQQADPRAPESFSQRLLRAKQQVWRDRDQAP